MDTKEIIDQAYGNIVNQLFTLKTDYIRYNEEHPGTYEGAEIDDFIRWLIKDLN